MAEGHAKDAHLVGTRDANLVAAWAAHHGAEPATGQQTASGPATVDVNDHGTGLRFNFPGAARFRPVSWAEWLAQFERDDLVFVYESAVPDEGPPRPRFGGAYYRLMPAAQWGDNPLASLAT